MSGNFNFQDKVALITGASSGIGAEFARQLHARGAKVLLVARRVEKLQALCEELLQRRSNSAEVLVTDLTSRSGLNQLCAYITTHTVDVLVNNAGLGSFGYFEQIPIEREHEIFALNIEATVLLAHAVIPQMKKRGSGALVSVSSIAAFQPLPYMSTYAASKAFNFIHSMGLREELRAFGVRALTLCPGPTATEFGGVARIPGKMTGIKRDSVESVVRQTLYALDRNRSFVVTGIRSKLLYGLMCICPWIVSTRVAGRVLYSTLKAVTPGK